MALFSPPGPPAGATCGRKSIVEPGTLLRADDKVEGIALENAASMASDIQTKGAAPSMADGRECYHKWNIGPTSIGTASPGTSWGRT